MEFKAGRIGCAYKGGKLYSFDTRKVMVLRAGSEPQCWVKTQSRPYWQSSRKAMKDIMGRLPIRFDGLSDISDRNGSNYVQVDGQLVWPFGATYLQRDDLEIYRYQQNIPPGILDRICLFSDRRWQMYNLLARVPGAIDLCDSNPALVYLLASNWIFHKPSVKNHLRAARALIWKKQAQALEWLGFPESKTVRNILRKIQPAALSVQQLLYLRNSIGNPSVRKLLAHTPSINCAALRLTTDPEFLPRLTPALLAEIGAVQDTSSREKPSYQMTELVKEVVRMAKLTNWNGVPDKFNSCEQLHRLHDQLSKETYLTGLNEQLPNPPLPGTEQILPIKTLSDLKLEAEEQENCVASYAPSVHAGHYYIYRVLEPIRATLSVKRVRETNTWRVSEIAGRKNRKIPPETKRLIRQALLAQTSAA